jgi:hypothetical protein
MKLLSKDRTKHSQTTATPTQKTRKTGKTWRTFLSEEFPTDNLTYLKGQPKLGECSFTISAINNILTANKIRDSALMSATQGRPLQNEPTKSSIRPAATSSANHSSIANMSASNSRTSPRLKKPSDRLNFFILFSLSHKQRIWVQSPHQHSTGLKPKNGRPFISSPQNYYRTKLHCFLALPTPDPNYCISLLVTTLMEHGLTCGPYYTHVLSRTPHKVSRRSKGTCKRVYAEDPHDSLKFTRNL